MLTVDAIVSKRFDKAMGGYRQDDVDAFLQQIAIDYEQLLNENQDLEDKLEILAEKIEQYRKDETGLKTALIGAQKLGEGLLRDAKNQVEQMRRDALRDLETARVQLEREIQREKYELSHLQKETSNFKNKLMSMYASQMDLIRNIPVPEELRPIPTEAAVSEEANQTAEQSEQPVHSEDAVHASSPSSDAAGTEAEQSEAHTIPSGVEPPIALFQEQGTGEYSAQENEYSQHEEPDSRFGPLKFGEGYEVAPEKNGGEFRKKFSFKKNKEIL